MRDQATVVERRRQRPSGGCHKVACCTSAASPSCWCRRNAVHSAHTCGPDFDLPGRTTLPHYAPVARASLRVDAARTTVRSKPCFHLSVTWYASDAAPSVDSTRPRWSEEPHCPSPTRRLPSGFAPVAPAQLPRSGEPGQNLPTVPPPLRLRGWIRSSKPAVKRYAF